MPFDSVHVIYLLYLVTGVLNGVWGATIPATDARLDLGSARLGAMLLAMAAGTLIGMPAAGRIGVLRLASGPLTALSLAVFALLPVNVGAFALGLFNGALTVALTMRAVAYERAAAKPIMSRLYGVWALGAVAASAGVAGLLRLGVDSRMVLAVTGIVLVATYPALSRKSILESPAAPPDAPRAPWRVLALLGLLGAAAFLAEGAAADWSGVYARRVLAVEPALASGMYAFFLAAMTVVRLVGDFVRARLSTPAAIRLAGSVAGVGYALVLAASLVEPSTVVVIAGWLLVGAGMAIVWPTVSSALGAAGQSAATMSAVATVAYTGGLIGPVVIGYTASVASLPVAMAIPLTLTVLLALIAPRVVGGPGLTVRPRFPTGPLTATTKE